MLVLSRKRGEHLEIGDDVTVTVVSVAGGRVRIGITAPKSVEIRRPEASSTKSSDDLSLVGGAAERAEMEV